MEPAGVGLPRRSAALVPERAYPVALPSDGARIPEGLTGLVGAARHAIINWSTFAKIRAMDPPIEHTIDRTLDPDMKGVLLETFPDARKARELGRLAPEVFEGFGPVQHLRDNFLAGWNGVLAMTAGRRVVARSRTALDGVASVDQEVLARREFRGM